MAAKKKNNKSVKLQVRSTTTKESELVISYADLRALIETAYPKLPPHAHIQFRDEEGCYHIIRDSSIEVYWTDVEHHPKDEE